jgi:predicted transcriptional regulator
MSKAIVETSVAGDYFAKALEVARLVDAGEAVPETDYSLGFSSAPHLFGELTAARMALLEALKGLGLVSIHGLAKQVRCNYNNVHSDVSKLLDLGLIEKDAAGKIFVPWDEIQVRVSICKVKAA